MSTVSGGRLLGAFVVLMLGLSAIVAEAHAAAGCEIKTKFTYFLGNNTVPHEGLTVKAALLHVPEKKPFYAFATEVGVYVQERFKDELCNEKSSYFLFSLSLRFIELRMYHPQQKLQEFRDLLATMEGAYAAIDVDESAKNIDVLILWNPRQVLRDQLLLRGSHFRKEVPLLPFDQDAVFIKQLILYISSLTGLFERPENTNRTYLEDLYGLFEVSPIWTDRFVESVDDTVWWMLLYSRDAYAAMAKAAIDRKLAYPNSPPIMNVFSVNDDKIETSYREGWAKLPMVRAK